MYSALVARYCSLCCESCFVFHISLQFQLNALKPNSICSLRTVSQLTFSENAIKWHYILRPNASFILRPLSVTHTTRITWLENPHSVFLSLLSFVFVFVFFSLITNVLLGFFLSTFLLHCLYTMLCCCFAGKIKLTVTLVFIFFYCCFYSLPLLFWFYDRIHWQP